jgi:hypothetical protein
MDWIFDNFSILAIVGIAMASWLKARADAKEAERQEREAREEMGETDEEIFGPDEPWREVQPPPMQSQPPPLVVMPRTPPPLPNFESQAESELKRQMQLQEKLKDLRESRSVTTGGALATKTRNNAKNLATPTSTERISPPTKLRGVLRQRSEIRRAVILREVLGPPVGLR